MFSVTNMTRCFFKANKASGAAGAIYVTPKGELKVYGSKFTLNTASSGGSLAVVVGYSFIESCSLPWIMQETLEIVFFF